jgi:hypothetical protein
MSTLHHDFFVYFVHFVVKFEAKNDISLFRTDCKTPYLTTPDAEAIFITKGLELIISWLKLRL